MKRIVLFTLAIVFFASLSFAQVVNNGAHTSGAFSPIGNNVQQGQTLNSDIRNWNFDLNTNIFDPTNIDINRVFQSQFGYVKPIQKVNIEVEAPRDLLPAPYIQPSQIQILPGKMWQVAENEIPNIGIPAYKGEEYVAAESFNGSFINRIRQEDLAEDLITFRERVIGKVGWLKSKIRLVVYCRDAGESMSTSGGGGGGYSANPTPAAGVSAAMSIFPGKARWKADYQYNPVFYLLK